MDYVLIEDLLARCIIGVNEEERRNKQDVVVNVVLGTDTREAGRSDDFAEALDYREIKKRIFTMMEGSQYELVEALAEAIADICLEYPRCQQVEVTVEKPSALRFARSVGVRITRSREDS
ncbi:MAG: dihydroneopterin aldolase [Armatimonadota bacterium]|nr:dihydroneopterin aldolase [Armatimonadota bacterium]